MAAPGANPNVSAIHSPVQTIRRFNRFYTRQIGVLQEHLLESQFSLTEVRVLYELAHHEHITAKELRDDLGLDRGYLSRMLQTFETQGFIKATNSKKDRRRVLLSLTGKGRKVIAPLEERSSHEVAAMLTKLGPAQQEKLLTAMNDIEHLLIPAHPQTLLPRTPSPQSAPPYILRPHRPGDMGWVVWRHGVLYSHEYRYDERFEALVAEIVAEFIGKFDPERERCWIAERMSADRNRQNVGSVFLVKKSASVAKLRLLLVEPSARGLGIGQKLVDECVRFAREAGYKKIMLWTQSELTAARRIYEGAGFQKVAEEKHKSWGRKDLIAETWELHL